jgi:hypothetical protein
MAKTTAKVLRAVTERVVDQYTGAAMLFTALDVSNAVKRTLPDVRHREVAPVVREMFSRGAMGIYSQTLIDVLAGGTEPTQAFLYHLPEQATSLYDDSMRSQLAIPPVSASGTDDDATLTDASTEAPVRIGKDGRGRVPRRLLKNAGISGDQVLLRSQPSPARLELLPGRAATDAETDVLTFEHPSLLHLPKAKIDLFSPGTQLVARIVGGAVEIVAQGLH